MTKHQALIKKIHDEQYGFLTMDQAKQLDNFTQILVRCGNTRFVTTSQNLETIVKIIENEGSTYIRDFSLYIG